jgi:50S ribosomal protein L16 3-hydroxylase
VLKTHAERFLDLHWQREPLFLRGGAAGFEPPADGDELAGLAMEDDVDARIVRHDGRRWSQERGPFGAEAFRRPGRWSLLVHGVDRYWDEAAQLFDLVPFLPRWRLDDVMMSFASDGASAGPHYDNYDVFIIQGQGQRRWQLGQRCDASSPLLDHTDMRLLARFEPQDEYVLQTGDVLYIPPGVAHYGVSIGESTSFSIGFRAPRLSDLLARWLDNRLDAIDDDLLYGDPRREMAEGAGEISRQDLARARRQLETLLDFSDPRWFGEAVTAHHDGSQAPSAPLPEDGAELSLAAGSRLAWHCLDDQVLVFGNGDSRSADAALRPALEALCRGEILSFRAGAGSLPGLRGLLQWLLDNGTLVLHEQ